MQWRRYNRRGDSLYKPRNKGLSTAAKEAANSTARLDPLTPPSEMAAPVTLPDPLMSEEEFQIDDASCDCPLASTPKKPFRGKHYIDLSPKECARRLRRS